MIYSRDRYGLPYCRRIAGYPLTIAGVRCTASEYGAPGNRLWRIRAEDGRLLGTGRSVSAAIRKARATIEGER